MKILVSLLSIVALVIGYALYQRVSEQAEAPRPQVKIENVVLVSFDALRADRLGAYGYEKDTSPALDAFAQDSVVFARSFSQCGSTPCSVASLMTSKYPATDQVSRRAKLPPGETTLAEILSQTMATGAVVSNEFLTRKYGHAQGFRYFDDAMEGTSESAEATGIRAMKTLRWLHSQSEPYFFWVHFWPPHSPYTPPQEFFDEFYPNPNGLETALSLGRQELWDHYLSREDPIRLKIFGRSHEVTKTILEQYAAGYDGNIKSADVEFGKIWDFLVETGSVENTLVIFTSDHGENLGEHGYFDHNNLYYGTIHTPLIIYSPNQPHRVVNSPVENVDIFPTILDSLGLTSKPHAADIRGRSLWSQDRDKEFAFSEFTNKAVIARDHLLIFDDQTEQLFDLNEAPDVDISAPGSAVAAELKDIYFDRIAKGHSEAKDDTLDALRSLGYIE